MQTDLQSWNRAVELYYAKRDADPITLAYRRRIRQVLLKVGGALHETRQNTNPSRFAESETRFVLHRLWRRETQDEPGLADKTRNLYISILSSFLLDFGIKVRWDTHRPYSDANKWVRQTLTVEEARALIELA